MITNVDHELAGVVREIESVAEAASADASMSGANLRQVLAFLAKVAQVVDLAFQDVLATLVELKYATPDDIASGRVHELHRQLDLAVARSHYRDATEICSRLGHLKQMYQEQIAPLISHLPGQGQWRGSLRNAKAKLSGW
jgi:hypothetical protein